MSFCLFCTTHMAHEHSSRWQWTQNAFTFYRVNHIASFNFVFPHIFYRIVEVNKKKNGKELMRQGNSYNFTQSFFLHMSDLSFSHYRRWIHTHTRKLPSINEANWAVTRFMILWTILLLISLSMTIWTRLTTSIYCVLWCHTNNLYRFVDMNN